jgi:hypothetical protein
MSKRNLFEYRKIALAPAEHSKVEVTFDGTFLAGDELCSDTPTTDKLLVNAYLELTTTDGNLIVGVYFNNKTGSPEVLFNVGDWAWHDASNLIRFNSDDSLAGGARADYGWKLGYKIALKAVAGGTGSGKLIIYYAIFA